MKHHIFNTKFGPAGMLFQEKPFVLKRVFLPCPTRQRLEHKIKAAGPSKPGKLPSNVHMVRDIQAYFNGTPIRVPWKLLDLEGLTPLQKSVLKAVARIPLGEVKSYGQIAAEIGRPKACRFVGTTMARNPFPILIPCHRIIRADGSPGRFGGGTDLKKKMLSLEKEGS